jgi:hypothetical protein
MMRVKGVTTCTRPKRLAPWPAFGEDFFKRNLLDLSL